MAWECDNVYGVVWGYCDLSEEWVYFYVSIWVVERGGILVGYLVVWCMFDGYELLNFLVFEV